jgi:uncharacterized protein YkwD
MIIRRAAVWLIILMSSSTFCVAQNVADTDPSIGFRGNFRNEQPSPQLPQLTAAASSDETSKSSNEDAAAEAALLESINRSRKQAGAGPLRSDDTLHAAAQAHVELMVANRRLEHDFPGEPALLQRIADVSPLALDGAGENIALATCADNAAEILFNSPPHRENLLNSKFNLAGIAAVWNRGHLYVVEDFVRQIQSYSPRETGKLVGGAIDNARRGASLPDLAELTVPKLGEAACNMATLGRPNAHLLAATYAHRKIISYTQSQPQQLPSGALRLLADPSLRQFAIGACYARNATYPTGTYWIAILLN